VHARFEKNGGNKIRFVPLSRRTEWRIHRTATRNGNNFPSSGITRFSQCIRTLFRFARNAIIANIPRMSAKRWEDNPIIPRSSFPCNIIPYLNSRRARALKYILQNFLPSVPRSNHFCQLDVGFCLACILKQRLPIRRHPVGDVTCHMQRSLRRNKEKRGIPAADRRQCYTAALHLFSTPSLRKIAPFVGLRADVILLQRTRILHDARRYAWRFKVNNALKYRKKSVYK